MNKNILILFVFFSINVIAQNALRFDNVITNDTVYVFRNDKVKLIYHGYLGQLESVKGRVLNVDNTRIKIGKKIFGFELNSKYIKISDIYGFKKYTIANRVLKTSFNLLIIAGSLYLPYYFSIEPLINSYAISLTAGLVGSAISASIFNDKINNTIKNGWKIVILYPKYNK